MGAAVMAVGTTASPAAGRVRIAYRDLDVEQLGAVYERVLEYEPAAGSAVGSNVGSASASAPRLNRTGDVRRSSGTFYTPRAVTAFLVRRTLEPREITISTDYSETVDLPFFTHTFVFHPKATQPL